MSKTVVFDNTDIGNACPPHLLDWCAQQWGENLTAFKVSDAKAICLFDDEWRPICIVVCDNWLAGGTCSVSVGTDNGKRTPPGFIRGMYEQIFDHWGANRMHMLVRVSNQEAINMHNALGHVIEGTIADWYGEDQDGYVYRFLKREWLASKWHPANRDRERKIRWEAKQQQIQIHTDI